ncbi:conserved hypothetical protein [Methylobacterium nodulans ORS 2060]|uniref:Translation initiation factor IF-2 n=1 Tax=Methylobacterium nodulans (strain LMG 21967 / CNCM I-2342 / ORS 2060) TaxID=460265 RepID=B8IPN2_METNO|nr:conserved hypothetical protein [Methylobacterium nodulans ORS 2060]
MIKRSLAAAGIATLGLATVAHANLSLSQPTPPAPQPTAWAEPTPAQAATRTPPKVYAEVTTLASTTQSDADEQPQASRPAPRVIDLPRADAPNQGYVPAPAGVAQPEGYPAANEPVVAPRRVRTPAREVVEAPSDYRRPDRPVGYRAAKWNGGGGATWKTGRDAYGFEGTFGGCHFTGFSGPHGFKLDRSCR